MRICLILGAGASYANGLKYRPVRKQATLPPLDYTFFDKISELNIAVPADLRAYARDLPTGDPFADGGRMEEFLRDLFHDFLSESDDADSSTVRAYRQMIEIYARVLRVTTDWMRQPSYSGGPVGKLIAAAADLADRVDIITFNHDLVAENEIHKRARLRDRWCIQRSYGAFAEGRTFLTTSGMPLFPDHDDARCDHSRPVVVHKMHGSLNWGSPRVIVGEVTRTSVRVGA